MGYVYTTMRYLLIILVTSMALWLPGCKKAGERPPQLERPFLALGDSYTIGQSVDPSENFPNQLKSWADHNGVALNEPVIIAKTGWTTTDLSNAIAAASPAANYSLVTLLIGVNDQYQTGDTSGYRARFSQLLKTAIGFAGGDPRKVLVLSIPDYSVTPFAAHLDTMMIREQVEQLNQASYEEAIAANARFVSITALTREAKNDLSLLAPDGLHPSGKEYARWISEMASQVKEVLQ